MRLVGVVSAHARAYSLSFAAGRAIEAPVSTRLADGMAVRVPDPQARADLIAYLMQFREQ
jgi:threonine dehydratase